MEVSEIFFKKHRTVLNSAIQEILTLDVSPKSKSLLQHQVKAGGKRIRPNLALLSCLACGGKIRDVVYPAAGLEILHTYTLIIDDIIDHSPTRRGKSTTWKKFRRSFAECIAADYGASLLQSAYRGKNPERIANTYAAALKAVMDGEMLDILFEQGGRKDEPYAQKNRLRNITKKGYLDMIGKKTASLLQASCEIGAISAKASLAQIQMLKSYGWQFGIAFQISDDVLDIYGSKQTGKPIGQDIREGKLGNITILLALQELRKPEQAIVKEIIKKEQIKEGEVKKTIRLIKETGAKDHAIKLANQHVKKAKDALVALPETKYKKLLLEIADLVVMRQI